MEIRKRACILTDQAQHLPGEQGIAVCKEAVALCADIPETYFHWGNKLMELRRGDEAITQFEIAIKLRPRFVAALNNLGSLLQDRHRFDEAASMYRRAMEGDPKFQHAPNNLAVILFLQGRMDEAVECCNKAIANDSAYYSPHMNLGAVYRDDGLTEQAFTAFDNAGKLNPTCRDPFVNKLFSMNDWRFADSKHHIVTYAHRLWGHMYSKQLNPNISRPIPSLYVPSLESLVAIKQQQQPLRVGFVPYCRTRR
jgi:tetratricopeptide (TPR) repeat protein